MIGEKLHELPLEDVLGDRFGRYSKYIIQERALPDVRDGLKPVQRRILYAMYVEGNTNEKAFRKSAKTVGNVIGNYHPHGDSSVYEAMVRLSQDWKVRNILVEMHGNNGSMDGDPPAAMRYTEARLSALSSELLRDIEKQTVPFVPNFDDTVEEPIVLPAMYPNLLVNGATGISAGYATDIPPHNLGEVIDATIQRINQPNCTVEDLLGVLKGPDFPTGGIIQGIDGIKKAYQTGKGRIIIRAKTEIETIRGGKQQIVITEIPYEVNKANLVKKIDDLRIDKKLEGIAEVRDETDRTGLRIVIELKKDNNSESLLTYLYKNTELQVTYNFNMVAISNKRPKLMGLLHILDAYIAHQKEVITNRSHYELTKANDRQHIVEGLIRALSILDAVIATIRAATDKRDAKNALISKYNFTDAQAEAIVMLQLYRLTNTDITALQKELDELNAKINELQEILNNENKLLNVIKSDLKRVKKVYGDMRRSSVEQEIEELKVNLELMIPQEDVIVTVTNEGYIKRTSVRSYSASNGKDLAMKESDWVIYQSELNTLDTLLIFTNRGNYVYLPVHQLPDIRWKDLGQHLGNFVVMAESEKIIHVTKVKDFELDNRSLLFVTKNGMTKKTELKQYKVQRYSKTLIAINVKNDDEVCEILETNGNNDIVIFTLNGYALRFNENEVALTGVRAAGVKGIQLKEDEVVSAMVIEAETQFVIITHRGAVKKMEAKAFEVSNRAKKGSLILKQLKTNPHQLVRVVQVIDEEMSIVCKTENGICEEINPNTLRINNSFTNGSFLIDVDESGVIISVYPQRLN